MTFAIHEHRIGPLTVYGSGAPCRGLVLTRGCVEQHPLFTEAVGAFKARGVSFIEVLISDEQHQDFFGGSLLSAYEREGFNLDHYAIPGFGVPRSFVSFHAFLDRLGRIASRERVLVQCLNGSGRTGLVLAGLHIHQGKTGREAVSAVRQVRPDSIDTREQLTFLHEYAQVLRAHPSLGRAYSSAAIQTVISPGERFAQRA